MWELSRFFCRLHQAVVRLLSKALRFREPELLTVVGSLVKLHKYN